MEVNAWIDKTFIVPVWKGNNDSTDTRQTGRRPAAQLLPYVAVAASASASHFGRGRRNRRA